MDARRIVVHGLRIRVLEEDGGGRGDPIVLIHALGGWAGNGRAVLAPLAATGRPATGRGLPGLRESGRPRRPRYLAPGWRRWQPLALAALDVVGPARAPGA